MKTMMLERWYTPMGTFGWFYPEDNDYPDTRAIYHTNHYSWWWFSCEPIWINNEENVSCIPEGKYIVKLIDHPRRKKVWEIQDVPDRTEIYFHVGNTIANTTGCVLLGKGLNYSREGKLWSIYPSGKAMKEFMEYMGDDKEFHLTVKQYKPMDE